jgi:hypothetical protein
LASVKSRKGAKITELFTSGKDASKATHARKVSRCELMGAAFFADHGIDFKVADNFWDFVKRAAPDSEILKTVAAKKTKMTYLITHGLAHEESRRVIDLLRGRKFTLML